jgi:hypothetical protein
MTEFSWCNKTRHLAPTFGRQGDQLYGSKNSGLIFKQILFSAAIIECHSKWTDYLSRSEPGYFEKNVECVLKRRAL